VLKAHAHIMPVTWPGGPFPGTGPSLATATTYRPSVNYGTNQARLHRSPRYGRRDPSGRATTRPRLAGGETVRNVWAERVAGHGRRAALEILLGNPVPAVGFPPHLRHAIQVLAAA
jgi:hypothetical protein